MRDSGARRIINQVRNDVFPWWQLSGTPSNVADPIYGSFVFDTNGLGLTTGMDIRAFFDWYTQDSNFDWVGVKLFMNNDPSPAVIAGGYQNAVEKSKLVATSKLLGEVFNIDNTYSGVFNDTYRYLKIVVSAKQLDPSKLSTSFARGVTCFVGGNKLPLINQGTLLLQAGGSLAITSIQPMVLSRRSQWTGKNAHFFGDSITQGLGTSTPTDPKQLYHALLKNQIGLSAANNYGVAGTHISGNYTNTSGNSGTPSQSFTARYSGMSNGADLVVVFGGTNDFGHVETAPIGTFADTTDISFYGACRVLMSGLINKYPTAQIVFMTPTHRQNDDVANAVTSKKLIDYVNIIKECAQYYAIPVLDLYTVSGIVPNISSNMTQYAGDGLHPNVAGHALIARKLAAFLETL